MDNYSYINNDKNIPDNFYSEKYNIHRLPYGIDFEKLTKRQVTVTFDWCMENMQMMIEWVRDNCSEALGISKDKLDSSLESIIYIWRWFLSIASLEYLKAEELEPMINIRKKYGQPTELPFESTVRLSEKTNYIMLDIAMYIGKCFTLLRPQLQWDCITKPKSDMFYGQPILRGFQATFMGVTGETYCPVFHRVGVQASHCIYGTQKETDMYEACKKWKDNQLPGD